MSRHILLRLRRASALALALLAATGSAQAQYINSMNRGFTFNNIYAAQADMTLSNMIRQGQMNAQRLMMEQMVARQAGKSATASAAPAAPPPRPTPPTPRAPLSATDFKPAPTCKAAEQIAAAVADPAGRAQMVQVCREIVSKVEEPPRAFASTTWPAL